MILCYIFCSDFYVATEMVESVISELLYGDDLVLANETIERLRN